ncbi:hypothetical protein Q5N38_17430 [Vibrio cholerae]|nr:hypothetical protein [Vibrio cholerae]MDV2311903.1 hypothetical protein [Vibrio cholerae]
MITVLCGELVVALSAP